MLMETYIITLLLLHLLLLISVFETVNSANNTPKDDQDLRIAIEEMQKANYFTFVMLINMSPLDQNLLGNVTFLMPSDRMLSKTIIPQNSVPSFLHRHSIPSPLLFEHLQHFPTGSSIPSSLPEYKLSISNGGGRRNFYLNNVRIISPNICTAGSSIRCHGIDGVLSAVKLPGSNISLPTCSNSTNSVSSDSPEASPQLPVPLVPVPNDFAEPAPAPQPADPSSNEHNSGSSQFQSDSNLLKFMLTLLVVSMIGVSI